MTEFLTSVKADLLDRRLLPILALLAALLVAALAYALLGGGSSVPTSPVIPAPTPSGSAKSAGGLSGIAVSAAPTNTHEAVAETTSGTSYQRGGLTHNPFTPLPGATTTEKSTPSAGKSASTTTPSSGSPTTSSGSSSKTQSSTTPASTPKSKSPATPKTVYHVAALFGLAAAGTPTISAQLTPYSELAREQALPNAKEPSVVFRGVTSGGKSAIFTLVSEAILRGQGRCLPSASQCVLIDLKAGQTEELEYLPLTGTPITYRLVVASITSSKASAAVAKAAFLRESSAGHKLLSKMGHRAMLPRLHYSSLNGVLAFAAPAAFTGRAHVAVQGPRKKP